MRLHFKGDKCLNFFLLHNFNVIYCFKNTYCTKEIILLNINIAYLQENGVNVIAWPSQSSDLNPIENLWAFIKRKLKGKELVKREDLLIITPVHDI